MALSLPLACPTAEVSSLNCVYLLAPRRENLPINCMLILSVNYLVSCCLSCCPYPNYHLSLLTNSWTYPHLYPHHPILPFWHFSPLLFPSVFVAACIMTAKSQIHTHKHVAYHGFGDMLVVAVDGTKKTPVMKNLPVVLGSHLLFHTTLNLWAQHSASLRCGEISEKHSWKERRNGVRADSGMEM